MKKFSTNFEKKIEKNLNNFGFPVCSQIDHGKNKIHISAYTQPAHLIFGTVIDIVSIFYHTKKHVGGLCVGGDMDFNFLFVSWELTAQKNFEKNRNFGVPGKLPV